MHVRFHARFYESVYFCVISIWCVLCFLDLEKKRVLVGTKIRIFGDFGAIDVNADIVKNFFS